MTTKEALHHLVDELAEDQTELAREFLEDLRDAADTGRPSLDRALEDAKSLLRFEHRQWGIRFLRQRDG